MPTLPALLACAALLAAGADDPPRWRDRRPKSPRERWDQLEGRPAPTLEKLGGWLNTPSLGWEQLRGNVVLVALWDSADKDSLRAVQHLATLALRHDEQGLVVLAVHGLEHSQGFEPAVQRAALPYVVAWDTDGSFTAACGAADTWPSYHLVDRDGRVRVAGVAAKEDRKGQPLLDTVVAKVLAEPWEGERKRVPYRLDLDELRADLQTGGAEGRGAAWRTAEAKLGEDGWPLRVEKPKSLGARKDSRGEPLPPIEAERWIGPPPELAGRPGLLVFWSTQFGESVPVMRRLQAWHERLGDALPMVGLSDQAPDAGSPKHPFADVVERFVKDNEITFHVGYDGQQRLYKALGTRSIPHVLLWSGDGVVRWQGYPNDPTDPLSLPLLKAFVEREARRAAEAAEAEAAKKKAEREGGGDGGEGKKQGDGGQGGGDGGPR